MKQYSILTTFIANIFIWVLAIFFGYLTMRYGWGLEVKNWGWFFFGSLSTLIIGALLNVFRAG